MTDDKGFGVKNILIVEDHELFGDGIAFLLEALFSQATIIRATDFDSGWNALHETPTIDLILMDLKIPGTTGLNGVRAIKQSFPGKLSVVISSLDLAINVQKAISLGVNGFISKSTPKEKMKQAFIDVVKGKIVIEAPQSELTALSVRQQQTLQLMAQGKSNKEIAKQLSISPNTAKEYVSIVITALRAENRTQAVKIAEQLGLLFDSE